MQIYLARNQVQAGPYTLDQLNTMLASQEVQLDDLMWHKGMAQWQRLGDMTQNQPFYNPSNPLINPNLPPNLPQPSVGSTNPTSNASLSLQKNSDTPQEYEIASVTTRILAWLVDQFLYLGAFLPIIINLDPTTLDAIKTATSEQAQIQQLQEALQNIPPHIVTMTGIFLLALMIVQIALLLKRGQTLGKLIFGIQILNFYNKKIPRFVNIILFRSVLTTLIYGIAKIGVFCAVADFVAMLINKEHRSLHDRLAKTYVVKTQKTKKSSKK